MTIEEIHAHLNDPQKPDLRYFAFEVARKVSDLAAVLLYDIYRRTTGRKKPLIKNGVSWTYDTLESFAASHPYASESGVRKAFLALVTDGLIRIEKTGKYNKKGYDGKWWYALTEDGQKRAAKRLMRFYPAIATSEDITTENGVLGIPTAVILEHFRHKLHEQSGDGTVTIKASELAIPYHPKTIGRHLDKTVANGILERDPIDADYYRIAVQDTAEGHEPLTVAPERLLPTIKPGDVGLITAPSGTAKTSFGTFSAVQLAWAGFKVVYVTVEEPGQNIAQRICAQEYGVSYSDLHQGNTAAVAEAEAKFTLNPARSETIAANLRIVDLSEQKPTPEQILAKIGEYQVQGFVPEFVLIDQLEFTSVPADSSASNAVVNEDDEETEGFGAAPPLAKALSAAFVGQPFKTWVLHQVDGDARPEFEITDVTGGRHVTDYFRPVLGIGRRDYDQSRGHVDIRVFSLTPSVPFESKFTADYARMRFLPKK